MELTSEQQRVMYKRYATQYVFAGAPNYEALYAAGAALLEYEARKAAITDAQWDALCHDIGDRRGLKNEWCQIDDDVKADIRGAWSKIFYSPAPAKGAKDQTQRFPIDRTDAYEERIDAERQAPRAESQDTVTIERAYEAAQRLINSHFHNDNRARCSIPADPRNDDDLVLMRFIKQVETTQGQGDEGMSELKIPDDLKPRYKLTKVQLAILPSIDDDLDDLFLGTRYQCEEVIQLIERIAALEAGLE